METKEEHLRRTMTEVNEVVKDIKDLPNFFRQISGTASPFKLHDAQRELLFSADVIQMLLTELENLVKHISPELGRNFRNGDQ